MSEMLSAFTVYMHIFPNKKRYIGLTQQNPNVRFHNGEGYSSIKKMYEDIKQYGWDNIEHKIIASNLSVEEACHLEVELIREYQTTNPKFGYNTLEGGKSNHKAAKKDPEEERFKMMFSDNIKELRKNTGISQATASEMIGISQPTYAQYELGSKIPSVYTAIKIAKLFGVTVEELAFGKENSK